MAPFIFAIEVTKVLKNLPLKLQYFEAITGLEHKTYSLYVLSKQEIKLA